MMFPRHPNDTQAETGDGFMAKHAARGFAVPVLHRAGRPVRRRGAASGGRRLQLRRHRQDAAGAAAGLRAANGAGGIVRFLSAANNSFKRDYQSEDEDGSQNAMLQVFHRDKDGIRHFWSSEMQNAKPDDGPGRARLRHGRAAVELHGHDAGGPPRLERGPERPRPEGGKAGADRGVRAYLPPCGGERISRP